VSGNAFEDKRTNVVIADGTKFVHETDERFDVILVDSTDPIGPGAVLFTKEFYTDCRRALSSGGILVTQNGLPFLQGPELKQSVTFFRGLFDDSFAYVATTPSYFGGSMSYGWATDDKKLRRHKVEKIARRYKKAGAFLTRYWSPEMQVAAFALPTYIRELVEPS
jgi:spermidine synthase